MNVSRYDGAKGRATVRIAALLGVVSFLLASSEAYAQSQPERAAAAEALFDEGKRLMDAGRTAEACPKFRDSYDLDPGVGVLLYLGDCYERSGRTASAWATFREAASAAHSAGQPEREKTAKDRAAALEPKLVRVTVAVPTDVPGLEIKRDGQPLARALWGLPTPLDPGKRTIAASAPGKKPWSTTVDLGKQPLVTVTIPPLEAEGSAPAAGAVPPPAPPGAQATPSTWTGRKTGAVVAVAAGLVGLGVGAAFGATAMGQLSASNANGHCTGNTCDATGVALRNDVFTSGAVSTVGFVAGGVLLAGGVVLWVTAPKPKTAQGTVGVASNGTGLALVGSFR